MSSPNRAAQLTRELLGETLPQRFEHVAGVAARVQGILASLKVTDEDLVSAAWLHDIGYTSAAVVTGFHALDGARFARRAGFGEQVVRLVAHHSCAHLEAELRGLDLELREEFPLPESTQQLILTAADMSVGPGGEPMSIDARLADIRQRYAPSDVVNRFLDEAEPELRRVVAEVEAWIAQSQYGVEPPSVK